MMSLVNAFKRGVAAGLLALGTAASANDGSHLLGLTLPAAPAAAPYPAVLLLHGCSGVERNVAMWQAWLGSKGYASAAVESFRRRGVSEICTNFSRVPMHERLKDVYAGLVEITARSDIDRDRVVVMGFSNGGVAVLSALTAQVGTLLAPGSPRFRAGIAFYPDCSLYRGAAMTGPILTLIGRLDDWTPASHCEQLSAALGSGFQTIVYPDAHHSFDMPNLPRFYMGSARNMHQPRGTGATVEGNPLALEKSKADVATFLEQTLKATR
jgi:dienelactone hydrolase